MIPNYEEEILNKLESLSKEMEALRERVGILEEKAPQPPEPIPYKETLPYKEAEEKAAEGVPLEELAVKREKPEVRGKIIRPSEKEPRDIEKIIGKWLPRIGMVALVVGAGFFLKYAFDHQWIGPTGRIIMGLFGGVLLLGVGEYFEHKKYHGYSRIFTGGGLALLYFSLYAARNFYQLIGLVPTFGAMVVVTAVAGFFAVRHNSRLVAFYSIIGGFATPFLIGYQEINRVPLLGYIAVLNLGILGLAFFKKWRALNLAAFIATVITYSATYSQFYGGEPIAVSIGFLTLYFLIFAFVAFLYNILYKLQTDREDIFLILFNAAFYYGFGCYLLKADYSNMLGLFTFCLAGFYLLLAYLAFFRNAEDKFLASLLLTVCVAFLTLGIAVEFNDYWITILWTIEALGLMFIGFRLQRYYKQGYFARILALGAFALTLGKLAFVDATVSSKDFTPLLNKRMLVFLLYIAALFITAKLYLHYQERISDKERKISVIAVIVANILIVYLISLEIVNYFGLKIKELSQARTLLSDVSTKRKTLEYQRNAFLSVVWALYSIVLMIIGIVKRYKPIRLLALILFGITTFKVFFLDLSYLKGFSRILSFIILGVILLAAGFLYNKYKDKIHEFV